MPSCQRSRRSNKNSRVVFLFVVFLFMPFLPGCGVKGKTQAPLADSPIGRGRPSFSKAISDLTKDDNKDDANTGEVHKKIQKDSSSEPVVE